MAAAVVAGAEMAVLEIAVAALLALAEETEKLAGAVEIGLVLVEVAAVG